MNLSTQQRLIEVNREFYDRFGDAFTATRRRLQPGAQRVLDGLTLGDSVLELGCGGGEAARALSRRDYQGRYLGLDFSAVMLREAERLPVRFRARFAAVDLTELVSLEPGGSGSLSGALLPSAFDVVLAFAVLHHIPNASLREDLARMVWRLLRPAGKFVHSSWQFLNSRKLAGRVLPWAAAGLQEADVDSGDYLLDWRGGGRGIRYVHHFSEMELSNLAGTAGFAMEQSFYSDGEGGRLGLYQVWRKTGRD